MIFNLFFKVNIFCTVFVLYKGHECLAKFLGNPQTTHVSIEHAYKHDYPAITICHGDYIEKQQIYDETLAKCNLTYLQYIYDRMWTGNGTEDYCSDAAKLYEKMSGQRQSIMQQVWLYGDGSDSIVDKDEYFEFVDDDFYGRCFSFRMIPKTPIRLWQGSFYKDAYVYVHMPGNFHGSGDTNKGFSLEKGFRVEYATLEYEIFEVLDFDGEPCKNYINGRDDCIHNAIYKESMDKINCTTPYGKNKSNICTNLTDAEKAQKVYFELIRDNITKANMKCPKSCTYMMTSFDTFSKDKSGTKSKAYLHLNLKEFIKVSRSQWSYEWLELLAEVGGYVGLFLGVSINQTVSIIRSLAVIFYRKFFDHCT